MRSGYGRDRRGAAPPPRRSLPTRRCSIGSARCPTPRYSACSGCWHWSIPTRRCSSLLAVTTTIGYAAGIAGRNAGRPWIALSQLCFASLPLSFGLILSFDPLKIALAVVIMLFVVAMMDITLQTYGVILQATTVSREKVALAEYHAAVARRDDLTGVANRTAFREQFEARLRTLCTAERWLTIHWIDLDRFKEINDSFGHLAGNALLAGVARRLNEAFGSTGIVARLGGDEFAVVCDVEHRDGAASIGRRIIDLVEQPVHYDGRLLHVGASLGIAIAPVDGTDADTLLKNADLALYRAKDSGRGQMCFYEPLMDEKVERSRDLASELQGALERGEFQLMFQPIFDLAGQRILSCEALLRWTNRRHGSISPAEFIPIAEDNGLIVPIGSWVIREACRTASSWPADVKIAVNLSPVQLRATNLPMVIMSALASSGLEAERLEARSDRVCAARRYRGIARGARRDQPPPCPHDARRFWHRLFVAQLFDQIPVPDAQDRPVVHRRSRAEPGVGGDRADGHRSRGQTRHADGGRGNRDASAARPVAADALRCGAGLSPRTADAGDHGRDHARRRRYQDTRTVMTAAIRPPCRATWSARRPVAA
ncbi:diguanylate cyclase [Sphingomonas aurantiaca]